MFVGRGSGRAGGRVQIPGWGTFHSRGARPTFINPHPMPQVAQCPSPQPFCAWRELVHLFRPFFYPLVSLGADLLLEIPEEALGPPLCAFV